LRPLFGRRDALNRGRRVKSWSRVRWTEASQVNDLAWDKATAGRTAGKPEEYYAWLKREGRLKDAAMFLGRALPRFETVAWAAKIATAFADADRDGEAVGAVRRWLEDPTDVRRRAAFDAAGRASSASPARLAALAAYFSGGSMSPEGQPPLPPPRDAAGRFAAGAVLLAVAQRPNRNEALLEALTLGEAIAADGLPAEGR
jgi:hypothetical protein